MDNQDNYWETAILPDETVAEILDECKYLWTSKKYEIVLIRSKHRFTIYHVLTQEIGGGTEYETVNKMIWANMRDAGVPILETFPNQLQVYMMIIQFHLRQLFRRD